MEKGRYSHARQGERVFIRLCGALKYTESDCFDDFINQLLADAPPEEILIDLTEATYLDSTNLGLIARIGDFMREERGKRAILVSTHKDINKILQSVRFEQVFTMIGESPESVSFEEIPPEVREERDTLAMMLRAHRSLIAVDDRNKEAFQDVVCLMEQELSDKE
jgi:anti-anti-sigma factor